MKRNNQLSRSQKVALLAQLVEGNAALIMQLKKSQDAPFAYLLDATQTFSRERSVLDKRPDDLITGIVLTSSYTNGKANKVEYKLDMVRYEFDAWYNKLRESGCPVVGMIRTYYAEEKAVG